ncbi:TPA: fimbria/pilus periplasmic chaperone [Enterobacter asburiae]|nr:fimbria/pilus periplasmic chaperone [Enterobacter asburiae]HDR2372451.1 fimbria/pilus periplasmic chaperone [Enterobacter asburiae]
MKSIISSQYICKIAFIAFSMISLCHITSSSAAGVALGSTRMIYPLGEKQASINVTNSDTNESFLVQSWVSDIKGEKTAAFVVTPPLFVLKPGKMNILRVMYVGPDLPEDKESVFYLNNKAIPSVDKQTVVGNSLQIATQSVIKLFVRPNHLNVKPSDAPAMLTCRAKGYSLVVSNPSPYYVTLVNFIVAGKKRPNTMVPPMGSQTVDAPGAANGTISYQTLNDFGAMTPALTCKA